MNENKVDFRGLIQQSHGLNGDCQYFDIRQVWNMAGGGGAEQLPIPYIGPAKSSSSTIMSRFESPASAFYAAEHCMGFAEFDCQVGNHSLSSQLHKINYLEFPMYQSPRENNHFLDSANPPDPNLELSNTLQAMVKSKCRSPEKSNKFSSGTKFLPIEQQKLFIDGVASVSRSSSFCNKGSQETQDHMVARGSYNLPVAQLSFPSQHEKLSPTLSAAFGHPASNGTVVSSKTRIRWTKDLHEKFVECVNRLGGSEKATPKTILKMMDSDGLTIFHIKSHLQKYRIAKFMPESAQGKSDKRIHTEDVHHLGVKTGLQIREALQLQLDAQRRLHEQLEIQRTLQLRIEEQGRQLKKMFDQQQKTCNNLLNTPNTANNDTAISHKDVDVSISEGAGNSLFPSRTFPNT